MQGRFPTLVSLLLLGAVILGLGKGETGFAAQAPVPESREVPKAPSGNQTTLPGTRTPESVIPERRPGDRSQWLETVATPLPQWHGRVGGMPEVIATAKPVNPKNPDRTLDPGPMLPPPNLPPIATSTTSVRDPVKAHPVSGTEAKSPTGELEPGKPIGAELNRSGLEIKNPKLGIPNSQGNQSGSQAGKGLVVEKKAPPVVPFGKPFLYEIVVANPGPEGTIRGIQIEEQLPERAGFLRAFPQPQVRGSVLIWNLPSLDPGKETRLKVEVQPEGIGDFVTSATVTSSVTYSMGNRVVSPGVPLSMAGPSQPGVSLSVAGPSRIVRVGEDAKLEIQLVNNSTQPLRNMLLRVWLQAGIQHPAGGLIEADVDVLAPGEKKVVPLPVRAMKAGRWINVVSIQPQGGDKVHAQNIVEVVDLANGDKGTEGAVSRSNSRPILKPADLGTMPSVPLPGPSGISNPPGTPSPEGSGRTLQGTSVPTGFQNPGGKTIPTGFPVNLEVSLRDKVLLLGGDTICEIKVINRSQVPIANVEITVLGPEGMTIQGAAGHVSHRLQGRNVAFDPLPELPSQYRALYQVRARGVKPGDWTIKVLLKYGSMDKPVSQEATTRVVGDTTRTPPG